MLTPVSIIVFTLLAAPWNRAREATRCEAIWQGPSRTCRLRDTWSATGTGRSETRARRAALARLADALDAGAQAAALQTSGTIVSKNEGPACRAAAEQADITCFPSPALASSGICIARFQADGCGPPALLKTEGVAWKAMEAARDQVCSTLAMSEPRAAARCRAECLQRAKVTCLADSE